MKRHIWVIEEFYDGEWLLTTFCCLTRKEAKKELQTLYSYHSRSKGRIVKYVPEEK